MNIGVIGAGIIGMSSAVAIQEQYPNAKITVIAAEFSPNLTSDVAAGVILPFCVSAGKFNLMEWFQTTLNYCKQLTNENAEGVQEVAGYYFEEKGTPTPVWVETVPFCYELSAQEKIELKQNPEKLGYYVRTYYLEPTKEIARLTKKFYSKGGKTIQKEVKDFHELDTMFDVIINCTGLGARTLCNDLTLYPVRGQIVRVNAPLQRYFMINEHDYALLNDDFVVLGGTEDKNEWELKVDKTVADRIIERNFTALPNLKKGTVLSHHVGLRPCRSSVRLEVEYIKGSNNKKVSIIHNYGHGGSGITLAWGCAKEVVNQLSKIVLKSKL